MILKRDVSPQMFETLIANLFDGVCQIDTSGRVIAWNQGAERITGIPAMMVTNTLCANNPVERLFENGVKISSNDLSILKTVKDGECREGMAYFKHAEGYRVSTLARTVPTLDEKGNITGAVEIFTDNKYIIAAFLRNMKVEHTIHFDAVTGIGNRSHIEWKINSTLDEFHDLDSPFGIIFIDIDHFKEINDSFGHPLGDKVLRFVANTLKQNLRVTDSCGRWGGDEFVGLALDIHEDGLFKIGEKLRSLVEKAEIVENDSTVKVTISCGATIVRPNDTFQSLLERVDKLLYKSKQDGRNRVTVSE